MIEHKPTRFAFFKDGKFTGITVEWKGEDVWAVMRGRERLHVNRRNFHFEPSPSNRTDDWKRNHSFTHGDALAVAENLVWHGRDQ